MKGICHTWSRGRLISPSLPVGDDWYLKLGSQKRPTGRNLGGNRLVRRSGTASRGTALLVFILRMRSFVRIKGLTIFMGKNIRVWSSKYLALLDGKFFNMWIRLSFSDANLLEMFAV